MGDVPFSWRSLHMWPTWPLVKEGFNRGSRCRAGLKPSAAGAEGYGREATLEAGLCFVM